MISSRRTVAVVALVSAIALAAFTHGAGAGEAGGGASDAFYDAPQRLAASDPGDVLRSEAIAAPDGARAWRVLYRSESVSGKPIAVSGVIVAPAGRAVAKRPIITWAHGTTGIADGCAPSRSETAATMIPFVRELVHAGYVVAATDYEGLGTDGAHPYLVGQSEGRGVLDAARAARSLRAAGAGNDVLVMGHSQGGQAALFAGELAGTYARELDLRGVVAIAPVTDLALLMSVAASIPAGAGYAVLAATGFHAAYPDADLDVLLTPEARAQSTLVERACAGDVIAAYRSTQGSVYAVDPRVTAPFDDLIAQNTPGRVKTSAPILLVQGTADSLVPAGLTEAFVPKLCAAGDVVEYRTYDGATHSSVVTAAGPDIGAWLTARLDDAASTSSCSRE